MIYSFISVFVILPFITNKFQTHCMIPVINKTRGHDPNEPDDMPPHAPSSPSALHTHPMTTKPSFMFLMTPNMVSIVEPYHHASWWLPLNRGRACRGNGVMPRPISRPIVIPAPPLCELVIVMPLLLWFILQMSFSPLSYWMFWECLCPHDCDIMRSWCSLSHF